VDIELGALEEMLRADIQFVLLGSGSTAFEKGYQKLALRFPARLRCGWAITKVWRIALRRHVIFISCHHFLNRAD